MKKVFYGVIIGMLVLATSIHFWQVFDHPGSIDANPTTDFVIYNGLSHLVFISLTFILCGWLAWLIYKVELYEMTIREKENETANEANRLESLEKEAKLRGETEKERNRINDFIRLVELAKEKPEVKTEEPVSEKKENTKNKTKTEKQEGLNLSNLDKLFTHYQNISSNPKNE
jgi:hypothetical protein